MLDIKTWLETAKEPVAETCFVPGEVPPLPYIVFIDDVKHEGADLKNLLLHHSLRIERYSKSDEYNADLETALASKNVEYEKDRMWDPNNEWFMTTYEFEFTEKD